MTVVTTAVTSASGAIIATVTGTGGTVGTGTATMTDRDRDRGNRDRGDRGRDRDRDRDRGDHRAGSLGRIPAVSDAAAKRRRLAGGLAGATLTELTPLLSAYVAAVNAEGPSSICDLLHDQLMKAREQLGLAKRTNLLLSVASPPRRSSLSHADDFRSRTSTTAHASPVQVLGAHVGDRDAARLFVGGLPHDCTDDDLASLAGQLRFVVTPDAAELLECRVLPGRGCGYLRYASWDAAEEAFAALQGRAVDGWPQPLRLQWATPKPGQVGGGRLGEVLATQSEAGSNSAQGLNDPPSLTNREELEAQGLEPTRLFVGQIARDSEAGQTLRPMFEQYGEITEFRWVQEKGVLYVAFSAFEEARAALQALGNMAIPGVSKGLNVRFSQRRF